MVGISGASEAPKLTFRILKIDIQATGEDQCSLVCAHGAGRALNLRAAQRFCVLLALLVAGTEQHQCVISDIAAQMCGLSVCGLSVCCAGGAG